ncbi:hypothetical protein [Pelagibius sp. Alg239-R121]|uniref:hypothetical protein n=1 Tax=Pelagibius sp. Alg239-R121 TaxID=2993448 RepID=UPI0024A6B639|nr:hypothetical protein [Pelagibius sp. Alg239-R121]
MRPSLGEVSVALYGAWRLMRFDPNGLNYFDSTAEAFWKSFYAAIICLPGIAIVMLTTGSSEASLHAIISNCSAYLAGWLVLAVVVHGICDAIGQQAKFIGCIVAINWSNVLQTYLILPIAFLRSFEGTPGLWTIMFLGALLFMLVYEGYVFSRSLEISGLAAAGLVAVDFMISLLLKSIVNSP